MKGLLIDKMLEVLQKTNTDATGAVMVAQKMHTIE